MRWCSDPLRIYGLYIQQGAKKPIAGYRYCGSVQAWLGYAPSSRLAQLVQRPGNTLLVAVGQVPLLQ